MPTKNCPNRRLRPSRWLSASPSNTVPPIWLTTREFSVAYGISVWTVRRWVKQGRVQHMRLPLSPRGRIVIRDPEWARLDPPTSDDPAEWLCVFRQCEVAALLGVTSRTLRNWERTRGVNFKIIGGRKAYSLHEVRRLLAMRENGWRFSGARLERLLMVRWAGQKLRSTSGQPRIAPT
jgi:hypothetical protein